MHFLLYNCAFVNSLFPYCKTYLVPDVYIWVCKQCNIIKLRLEEASGDVVHHPKQSYVRLLMVLTSQVLDMSKDWESTNSLGTCPDVWPPHGKWWFPYVIAYTFLIQNNLLAYLQLFFLCYALFLFAICGRKPSFFISFVVFSPRSHILTVAFFKWLSHWTVEFGPRF